MNHEGTKTQRKMKADRPEFLSAQRRSLFLSLCLCALVVSSSCGSKPTDLRTLVPADSLIYLETNDLGAALQPIIDSKPFNEVAKSKPDLSALKGVQIAVAITGFETSEEKLTDEHSVGKIQPHFVAVAETHAWQFQTERFAEAKLGSFVANIYDSEPTLEKHEKGGGHYLTWTAKDGRKAFALVAGSLIYFSNDESAIEKCLAVKRGEADSIAKTAKVAFADPANLASGYISTDGVAQIANIAALKFASDASDESEVQSAIAGIIPQLIRGTVTDATWTQTKTDAGIEDKWQINMTGDVASVFSETLAPILDGQLNGIVHTPAKVPSATLYNFREPNVAWRSAVLIAGKNLDPLARQVVGHCLPTLFEPYGIRNPEAFLKSVRPKILVVNFAPEGDEPTIVASSNDLTATQKSLTPLSTHFAEPNEHGVLTWFDEREGITAKFLGNEVVAGSDEGVGTAFNMEQSTAGYDPSDSSLKRLAGSDASIATLSHDVHAPIAIGEMFSQNATDSLKVSSMSFTETRFNRFGMERKTTSDFGFIGWIIAQLNED